MSAERPRITRTDEKSSKMSGGQPLVFYTDNEYHNNLADYANRLKTSEIVYCLETDADTNRPILLPAKVLPRTRSEWESNLHYVSVQLSAQEAINRGDLASEIERYQTRSVFTESEVQKAMQESQFAEEKRPIHEILEDPVDHQELGMVLTRVAIDRLADEMVIQFQESPRSQLRNGQRAIQRDTRPSIIDASKRTDFEKGDTHMILPKGSTALLGLHLYDQAQDDFYSVLVGDIELDEDLAIHATDITRSGAYPYLTEDMGLVSFHLDSEKAHQIDKKYNFLTRKRKEQSAPRDLEEIDAQIESLYQEYAREELMLAQKLLERHQDLLAKYNIPLERVMEVRIATGVDLQGHKVPWTGQHVVNRTEE